jgi:hypothetical protein
MLSVRQEQPLLASFDNPRPRALALRERSILAFTIIERLAVGGFLPRRLSCLPSSA